MVENMAGELPFIYIVECIVLPNCFAHPQFLPQNLNEVSDIDFVLSCRHLSPGDINLDGIEEISA